MSTLAVESEQQQSSCCIFKSWPFALYEQAGMNLNNVLQRGRGRKASEVVNCAATSAQLSGTEGNIGLFIKCPWKNESNPQPKRKPWGEH